MENKEKYWEAFELWKEASQSYYNADAELLMSDIEFDSLTQELLESNIEEIVSFVNKGIMQSSGELKTDFSQHESISLYKIKYRTKSDITDIKSFFLKQKEFYTNNIDTRLYYSPKLDGNSLKLIFEQQPSRFSIITRGGMDITDKCENIRNIKKLIQKHKGTNIIITGELVINKKIFEEKYSIINGGEYENARNFISSVLKPKLPDDPLKRKEFLDILSDLIFIPCTDGINKYDMDNLWLEISWNDLYTLEEIYKLFKSDSFPFLCDGIVLSMIEPTNVRRVKDNYPLNMVAVKFPSPTVRTKVIDIIWTQKKSGNLTPVLQLEPVKLEGSMVSQANGYNYTMLLDKHIGIGAIVEITKSGDIIPIVIKTLVGSKNIKMPNIEYIKSGRHIKAVNQEETIKFKFTAGLTLLNIDGIGPTIAEKIGQIDVINYDILKIFDKNLKPDILNAIGDGAVWLKFSREIYSINTLYLDKLINLLQFNGVGIKMSERIANIILGVSRDTKGMSDQAIKCCSGENFQKIKNAINELKSYGISVIKPQQVNEDTITFEMTGEPPKMTKELFVKKFLELYPNSLHTSLTKSTNYLFTNDISSNTGKINKARKYSVKIITYQNALNGNLS
jgi:NAD-dependent DNA ligase